MNINVTFEQTDMSINPDFRIGLDTAGTIFFPSVSKEGIISWTNNGNLPNPEPVNIKGKAGDDGKDGQNGMDGQDGYTPVRGADYWTEEDKAKMVEDVIAALPVYNGEVV